MARIKFVIDQKARRIFDPSRIGMKLYKMKRLFNILCAALLLALTACQHEEIWDKLNDHEQRIELLEKQCRELNSNIAAIQTILAAVQQNDYVTDVMKVMENGVEVGYSITFAKSGTITIYHGTNGADGDAGATPQIGVKKAEDGSYYWTSNGEWITDENGDKIPAAYSNGGDGKYITPQFRVVDDVWYVSYDNGNSWRLYDDSANNNEAGFTDIVIADGYIVLTTSDGTTLQIPTKETYDTIQSLVDQLNVNASSLRTIVMAMESGDCISLLVPLVENSKVIGYMLNFSHSGSATIYYNPDGWNDKDIPIVGVKQLVDGVYYWTVNGSWYIGGTASKIPVISNETSVPMLKVEDGLWYISFDNDATWQQVETAGESSDIVRVPYSLVHGNRYSSVHTTENTRASIFPYSVKVPSGVTIKPKDGYVWGWYTNVNTSNPTSSTLASGGWVTTTYTGNGSGIGVTVKKTTDEVIDFSVDGDSWEDYLDASDPSIWYMEESRVALQANQTFSMVDLSSVYCVSLTLADGTIMQILTREGVEGNKSGFWQDKSIACIGDSITAGSGTTKTYWEYLGEILNPFSIKAMGVSGSCVSALSDYGTSNSPLINRYTSIPDADVITIYMGTNDYGHETPLGSIDDNGDVSFYGALNTIIPGIIAAHPDSRLIWITPTHRYGRGTSGILGSAFTYDYIPNGRGASLKDYVDAIKAVCERHSVPVIDLYQISGIDPSVSEVRSKYMPDGLHPNAAGHQKIAEIIAARLNDIVGSFPCVVTEN